MNIKVISRYTGIALLFNALFMFLSVVVSMINGFDSAFSPLLLSALITAMVGIFPFIFVRESQEVNVKEGFAITFFSWVLSCLFGMLPYLLWGGVFTLSNAWFESVSGYTTTGGTIIADVEALPKSLLFWRSSTHYIGGMGVMVFMLLVLPSMSTFRFRISKIEISSLSKNNYQYRSKETLKVISSTYLAITVLCFFSLMLAGMNGFDAINHAMSIVSTGGFSTRNQSIMSFNSVPIEIVCIIFMYISALHFGLMYMLVVKRSTAIFKSPVFRYYTLMLIVVSLMMGIDLKTSGNALTWGNAMRQSFFQVVSICTTTGFATADTNQWPVFSMMLLIFMAIHGSMSGSTSGGLKADRVWIFLKSIKINILKQLHPNAVITIKSQGTAVDSNLVNSSIAYIALYLFIMVICWILLAVSGTGFVESMTASVAAMGNVGPGLGTCGSLGNFYEFNAMSKFILTVEMILGRLEIYSALMVFRLFKKN